MSPGRRRHIATLSVSGDMDRPDHGRAVWIDDHIAWPTDILTEDSPSIYPLNALRKPPTRLRKQKDKLVFEDGTVARFWGTNLTSYTLFGTSKENVKQQARRLSELGFNLVRLHHHDSSWVNPNILVTRFHGHAVSAAMLTSRLVDKCL
jgi:hypothetical protein